MQERRTIKLGAVQVKSEPGQVEANLAHASSFIEKAAADGAAVVVLPELFGTGYIPNQTVWDAAEPVGGKTSEWLASTAQRLSIHLGAGTVETDGSDFYNVFLLAGPEGKLAGRVYKTNAEANVFKRQADAHIIETSIGRIGVGICADNQFAAHLQQMHDEDVDMILMPHAWPTPSKAAGLVSEKDVARNQERMIELPRLYARSLGVPVVFVNQVGQLLPIGGILGRLMDTKIWRLRGQSRIVDSDGSELGALGAEEGVLVTEAHLDPMHKHYVEQPAYDGWLQPGAWPARHVFIPLDIRMGVRSYRTSAIRKERARQAARRQGVSWA